MEAPNPKHPEKTYYAKLEDQPLRTSFATAMRDRIETFYVNRNELVRRLLADTCELCGSKDGISVHHILKRADIKKPISGQKFASDWTRFTPIRNTETVVVCHKCH